MLKNLLKDYLDYLEIEKNRSIKTVENYKRYLSHFLDWAKVSKPREINDDLVRKYRIYLNREGGRDKKPLKKITQNYYIIALRGFLKYLTKRKMDSLAPERVELAKTSERDIDFLEVEEVERLLSSPDTTNLRGLRDKAILETLFSTGLRVSEICGLDRDSINFKRNEFSIRGKGDKVRVVFLSERAKKALKEYLDKRIDIDEALFIRVLRGNSFGEGSSSSDLRLTPRSIQRLIKKYATKAGLIKDIHPHTLRHSYATDLLRNGADLRSVQALLGHSNITTTQIYTHVTDKQLREVHQRFHSKKRKINNSN